MRQTGSLILIFIVLVLNISLLNWTGVELQTLAGSYAIQLIWTLGGAYPIIRHRDLFHSSILFWLTAWVIGLVLFYFTGLIVWHRGLLGEVQYYAALVSLVPHALLALGTIKAIFRKKLAPLELHLPSAALLLSVAFIVTAMATYGFGNNKDKIRVADDTWSFASGPVPVWSFQSDRVVHIERITKATYDEGFPPKRLNHRGHHVTVVNITVLTGEASVARFIQVYKTLSLAFFFIIAYGLYSIGRWILDLSNPVAILAGISGILLSPLKLPLIDLSPTYRGFFSASGTLYHSDTQNSSVAVTVIALFLLAQAFKTNSRGMLLGCTLLAGSFFLKPSNFMMLAPAIFLMAAINWNRLDREWIAGLAVLMLVPVIWFSYIFMTGSSSALDIILGNSTKKSSGISMNLRFFQAYLPRLDGRFPGFIDGSPFRMALAMTLLSFAAFWPGAIASSRHLIGALKGGVASTLGHLRKNSHIYLMLGAFAVAILISLAFGQHRGKNINWKWAAAAGYLLYLPLFIKGITVLRHKWLRLVCWGLIGVQLAQGAGYLWYLFYYSKLV